MTIKLHVFPLSPRAFKVLFAANHLGIDYEMAFVDLPGQAQKTPGYTALNPNQRMPVLEDDGFVLWESNAILFYLASKKPDSRLWPSDVKRQADVLRWLAWESAHWDAESIGMVGYEKTSRRVLGLGPADPAFIARGEQNFDRFAAVLNQHLKDRTWLTGNDLTIADFSVGGMTSVAVRLELLTKFPEIARWYDKLAALPAWQASIVRPSALRS